MGVKNCVSDFENDELQSFRNTASLMPLELQDVGRGGEKKQKHEEAVGSECRGEEF